MKTLVDTNIWVYAYGDSGEPRKSAIARQLLGELFIDQCVVISCQVINETYSVLVRKYGFTAKQAQVVFDVQSQVEVVETKLELIETALMIGSKHKVSHWDALIIAAALRGGCSEIVTEDLQHGQVIEGVRIVNPYIEEG